MKGQGKQSKSTKYGEEQNHSKANGNSKDKDNLALCIDCTNTHLAQIFEPMAAVLLEHFAMALLNRVSNLGICNPGITFLWSQLVDPTTIMTILQEYVVSG